MLQPARVKYRKMHRGSRAGLATRGNTVAFGEYGLQSLERCWLDTKQIEAARVAINRNMKRRGKVWIRVFPQKSYTKKPLETRMGKGKGPRRCSSRWTVCLKCSPASRSGWRRPSSRFARGLSRGTGMLERTREP